MRFLIQRSSIICSREFFIFMIVFLVFWVLSTLKVSVTFFFVDQSLLTIPCSAPGFLSSGRSSWPFLLPPPLRWCARLLSASLLSPSLPRVASLCLLRLPRLCSGPSSLSLFLPLTCGLGASLLPAFLSPPSLGMFLNGIEKNWKFLFYINLFL